MRLKAIALLFPFLLSFGCGSTPDSSASTSVDVAGPRVSAEDARVHENFRSTLVGRWHVQSNWFEGRNTPVRMSEGSAENVSTSNGEFIVTVFDGPILMGSASDGATSLGYNAELGTFVTQRTNGKGQTVLESQSETFDVDSNTVAFRYGPLRETITVIDQDQYVHRMWRMDDEGAEFLTLENVCTRMEK
ncbi:MAG: DUF1579 domain-containing protein [bacterium]|nr:DUF1579 domain-containing protein [bacterium]